MIKKLVFTALISSTMLIAGAFMMKEGEPLKNIAVQVEENNNESTTDYSGSLGQKIFGIDFNTHPVGNYTVAMQDTDFMTYNGENLHYNNHDGSSMIGDSKVTDRANIVDDGGENVLDILYKAGGYGLSGGGLLLLNALPKNGRPAEDVNNPTEITLIYYVKFDGAFDWGQGGKLPGLGGGLVPSAQNPIGGYNMENGYLARHMWEVLWGSSRVPGIKPYVLHPGRTGTPGKSVNGVGPWASTIAPPTNLYFYDDTSAVNIVLTADKWYKIQETIKVNTPGASNGYIKMYVNDVLAADIGNMKLVADGKAGDYTTDRFMFATFYGGGSADWAPKRDTHIRFKDISIYEK